MTEETKTCTRPGCGKTLRKNNARGLCRTGCLSPEAPGAQRAKGVEAGDEPGPNAPAPSPGRYAPKAPSPSGEANVLEVPEAQAGSLERFTVVAKALGMDPGTILAAFADAWLAGLRGRLEPQDS